MAANSEGKGAKSGAADSGGDALAALTPPPQALNPGESEKAPQMQATMMVPAPSAADQMQATMVNAPQSAPQVTLMQPQGTGSGTHAPASSQGSIPFPGSVPGSHATPMRSQSAMSSSHAPSLDSVPLSVAIQDLSGERLLQNAPRVESHGVVCPALNGIPMLAKIGAGGMGAVYYGIHPRLRCEVAVKVLPFHLAEQDPGMIRRFYREAQIAAQVRSPNLVNVTDVNEECGLFFLVMEYVNGKSAGQLLKATAGRAQPGLSEKDVLDIVIGATEGLHAAHSQGVVHRDIKPDNIMIPYMAVKGSQTCDLKKSKLMDLGLARNEESGGGQSLTGVQTAMGTPGFMAPEQALDAKTADKRSDVFSMGGTVYALLCGSHPFVRDATMKTLMATVHEPHDPIKKIRPEVIDALNDVVNKCLEKKQENRFADAQELLRALKGCRKLIAAKTQIGPGIVQDTGDGDDDGATIVYTDTSSSSARPPTQATLPGGISPLTASTSAPKKKGMLYVAAGVTVAALVGGGAFLAMKKGGGEGKPDDQGQGNIVTTGPDKTIKPDDPGVLAGVIEDLASAEGKKAPGNTTEVEFWFDHANKVTINDPEVNKRKKVLENWIKLQKSMAQADDFEEKQNYKLELDALRTAKTLAKDKNETDTVQKRLDVVSSMVLAEGLKADAAKANKPEEKLMLAQKILKILPSDTDALEMQRQCEILLKDKLANQKYNGLMTAAKELEAQGKFSEAVDTAMAARAINSAKPEPNELIERARTKLGKAEQEKQEEVYKAKFADSIKKTEALYAAMKLQEADDEIKTALGIFKSSENALGLQKKITEALLAEQKKKEDATNHQNFDSNMKAASSYFAGNDFKKAREELAKAKLLFPLDPAIKTLDDAIASKVEVQRRQTEYEHLLLDASASYVADKLDDAALKATQARDIFAAGSKELQEAIGKGEKLAKLQKDIDAKQTARINELNDKQGRYNKLIADADSAEKKGDAQPEWSSERITQYQMAKQNYTQAKAITAGGAADQKDTAIQKKLADARAAGTAMRSEFDKQLKSTEALADKGDFDGALKALESLKPGFDNKAVAAKAEGYQTAKLEAERKIQKSIALVQDSVSHHLLGDAIGQSKKIMDRFPSRTDMAAVFADLGVIQQFDTQVHGKVADTNTRLAALDRKLNGKGGLARDQVVSARDSVEQLSGKAMDIFAKSEMKGAEDIVKNLGQDLQSYAGKIDTSLADLDQAAKAADLAAKAAADRAAKEEAARIAAQPRYQPPERVQPPPRKSSGGGGGVGEQNPFD